MMEAAILVKRQESGTVISQPTVEIQQAVIGNAVNFLHNDIWWAGRVIDIRPHLNNPNHDLLSIAVLGWPIMFSIERDRGAWVTSANSSEFVHPATRLRERNTPDGCEPENKVVIGCLGDGAEYRIFVASDDVADAALVNAAFEEMLSEGLTIPVYIGPTEEGGS